jgi:hypothetical protein
MTPAKFYAYANAWKDKQRRENYRFGTISYVVRAIMGDKNADPMDFFEDSKSKKQAQRLRALLEARTKKKN